MKRLGLPTLERPAVHRGSPAQPHVIVLGEFEERVLRAFLPFLIAVEQQRDPPAGETVE
jgi:hypothetical protein